MYINTDIYISWLSVSVKVILFHSFSHFSKKLLLHSVLKRNFCLAISWFPSRHFPTYWIIVILFQSTRPDSKTFWIFLFTKETFVWLTFGFPVDTCHPIELLLSYSNQHAP